MISERGLSICHSTIVRWVHQYGPLLDKKVRKKLKKTGDSWKLDETYVKVKGKWKYCLLYTSPSPRDAHESRMPSSA